MSLESISKINPATRSFDTQVKDVDGIIFSYMSRKEIQRILTIEELPPYLHSLISNASKAFSGEDQACIREGFSPRLVQLFSEHDSSLGRIPVINLEETEDSTYISPKDMQGSSIVRFKEKGRCPGRDHPCL